MARVYLSIGGNQGDREDNLLRTIGLVGERIGRVIRCSSVYESEPWGFVADRKFLNQVLLVDTELNPASLLLEISYIETLLGRVRKGRGYTSRTMDIDVLFYDHAILFTPDLTVPHRQLHRRLFVLEPLCEIAPDFIHPLFSVTVRELLSACDDSSKVWKLESVSR